MSIRSFKKENLYFIWDDSLVGKAVVCSDSLGTLYDKLECDSVPKYTVSPSYHRSYPFIDSDGTVWNTAYVLDEPTDDPGDSLVKQAYLQGHTVVRRLGDDDWESLSSTSYFDLPGYEYKVASCLSSHVTNKELATWLSRGSGLLFDEKLNRVSTTYDFMIEDMDCKVPDGYKVMPIGGDEWLEPTESVLNMIVV